MARNCFRYLGFTSFDQVDRLTLREYNVMMEAHAYRQVDEALRLHELAWASVIAGGRKKNGSPVYRKFSQFFNYEKALRAVEKEAQRMKKKGPKEDRFAGVRAVMRRQMKQKEE